MAEHNEIGKIGENITRTFLMKRGFTVHETNYHTRYGELDLVAEKDKRLRFVEVKSIKVRDFNMLHTLHVRPEDNVTDSKWSKLVISIETYLRHKNVPRGTLWQMDLSCVYINPETREGKVVFMENVHKE